MNSLRICLAFLILLLLVSNALGETLVPIDLLDAKRAVKNAGSVAIHETDHGLVFTPSLKGLPPGLHGFHVHQNPSCASAEKQGKRVAGLAAGGHFDPRGVNHHGPPWGDGHLGDLPLVYVDDTGHATTPVLAPRLKMSDVKGRALMLHGGGDNYSDQPQKLGGGGARMACGLID